MTRSRRIITASTKNRAKKTTRGKAVARVTPYIRESTKKKLRSNSRNRVTSSGESERGRRKNGSILKELENVQRRTLEPLVVPQPIDLYDPPYSSSTGENAAVKNRGASPQPVLLDPRAELAAKKKVRGEREVAQKGQEESEKKSSRIAQKRPIRPFIEKKKKSYSEESDEEIRAVPGATTLKKMKLALRKKRGGKKVKSTPVRRPRVVAAIRPTIRRPPSQSSGRTRNDLKTRIDSSSPASSLPTMSARRRGTRDEYDDPPPGSKRITLRSSPNPSRHRRRRRKAAALETREADFDSNPPSPSKSDEYEDFFPS